MSDYELPEGIVASKENHLEHVAAHMLIVVGPSGSGKSTLLGHLLAQRQSCGMSRSTTTRKPRGNEQNGVEYDFVDIPTFEQKIADGAFAEYANVFGNYYGTPHEMIRQNVDYGRDVLFDIDVQGARNIKKQYPGAWCVLIAPPSMAVLEKRLRGRATDAPDVIEKRLITARKELAERDLFDFVIINDDLATAQEQLVKIYDMLALRAAH
jgi:guanylate kinase